MHDDLAWRAHLRSALPAELQQRWGWGRNLDPRTRGPLQLPGPETRVSLADGGLDVPYHNGYVDVDFAEQAVLLYAVDQKTPSEERWRLTPPEAWWRRARELRWPS